MRVLGLDIGGANVKASSADGESISISFPIWENKDRLRRLLETLPVMKGATPEIVAITMTAELADCFATKAEGVEFIVRVVAEVFAESIIRVWLTSGEFVEPDDAIELPELAGASNWHALATWAGRAVPSGPAMLIDVGSTTTDIVPLMDGLPISEGRTDLDRLKYCELLYTGIRRTPVCAMVATVPLLSIDDDENVIDQVMLPLAAELFATSLDVHILNGDIAGDDRDLETADRRPANVQNSLNRMAHMLCCDAGELTEGQLKHIAAYVSEKQVAQIAKAIRNRCEYLRAFAGANKPIQVLLSGSGAWLAERALQEPGNSSFASISHLSEMFVRNVSGCAPAFAVARLAAERCLDDLLPVVPF